MTGSHESGYRTAASAAFAHIMRQRTADILAIESSCDETSAAVVRDGRQMLSLKIASQIDIHVRYGGVVPEIASRMHMEAIDTLVDTAVGEAGTTLRDVSAIAVTTGPGLVGALLVGVSHAKAMAWALRKPLVGVHHIEGHIASNYIAHRTLRLPSCASHRIGGHTLQPTCPATAGTGCWAPRGTTRREAFDRARAYWLHRGRADRPARAAGAILRRLTFPGRS